VGERIRGTQRSTLEGPVGVVQAMRQQDASAAGLLVAFAGIALVAGLILLVFDAAWMFVRSGRARPATPRA
jgi:hypothetical protein